MTSDLALLATILDQNPLLSWRGFWGWWHDQNEPAGTLDRVRKETLDDYGVGQFRRAMAFLAVAPKTRALNREHGTYGWKHCAERWWRTEVDSKGDYYIGEGAFIAACHAHGMTVRRGKYANYTNLSALAWSLGERGRA